LEQAVESVKVEPIDTMVFEGFQERFRQVFGCTRVIITNEHEKTKILEAAFGQGKPLEYPYAYIVINTIAANNDSYNSHSMMRRGLVINVPSGASDQVQQVRILPTNFELEIHYVTNKFNSVDQGSVTAFARRWLLARRAGYLKFNIKYGRLNLGISNTMPESVTIPQRDNIVEGTTDYDTTITMTVHGYVSEPILNSIGKVNIVNVQSQVGNTKAPVVVSTQNFTFPPRT
jgi:hypothetical protein